MAVEYGTIGIRPRGKWDPDTKYDLLNLVTHDGSSYVAHTDPPVGTLPTNLAYWQVSAQGTGKATADSVGTVKPDGATTEVSPDGVLSAKQATQSTAGIVKGSAGIKVGDGGSIDVNTEITQAAELANIIAGEAIASVLGKVSKAIAATMNLDQNALLKNMLTSIDVNDSNKVPTAAFIHTLVERIGMGEELDIGASLTNAVKLLKGNKLDYKKDVLNGVLALQSYFASLPDYSVVSGFGINLDPLNNGAAFAGMYIMQKHVSGYGTIMVMSNGLIFTIYQGGGVWGGWQSYIKNSDLRNKVTLGDTGVFHITRQTVMEYPDYYAVAVTIVPTTTPTTDTPMLTFPKQLATCVLPITTGFANGITYASNNNQMFYRLLSGTINNTTEIIINGIIPKA